MNVDQNRALAVMQRKKIASNKCDYVRNFCICFVGKCSTDRERETHLGIESTASNKERDNVANEKVSNKKSWNKITLPQIFI